MRVLVITLLCLFVFGCTPEPKKSSVKLHDVPLEAAPKVEEPKVEPKVEEPKEEPKEEPENDEKKHTPSYKRGYKDGYGGNWVSPIGWIVANEYRAGWNEGNRDLKDGNPNKFD
jgi:hypothetical protein